MSGGNGQKPGKLNEQKIPVRLSVIKADPMALYMHTVLAKGKLDGGEEFDLCYVETNPPSFMVKVGGDRYLLRSFDLMKAVSVIRKTLI